MDTTTEESADSNEDDSLQRHRTLDSFRQGWDAGVLQPPTRGAQVFSWDDDFWKRNAKKGPQSIASSASTFEEVESLCLSKSSSDSMSSSQRQWERVSAPGGGSASALWGGPPSSRRYISRQSSTTSTSTSRSSGLFGDGAGADPPVDFNRSSRPSITDTLLESMELLGTHGNLDLADKLYLEKIFHRVLDWDNGMPISSASSSKVLDNHFWPAQQPQRPVTNSDPRKSDQHSHFSDAALREKLEKLRQSEQSGAHGQSQPQAKSSQPSVPEKKRRRDLIIPDEEEPVASSHKHHKPSGTRKGPLNRGISLSSRETTSKEQSSDSFSKYSYLSSVSSFSMDNGSLRGSPQGSAAPAPPPVQHPKLATFLPSHSLKHGSSFESTASPPDSYMFSQPFTTSHAERVLMGLGFGAAEGFLPERFLRDWYNKVSRAQIDSQLAILAENKEKENMDNLAAAAAAHNMLPGQNNGVRNSADMNTRPFPPLRRDLSVTSSALDEAISFCPPTNGPESKIQQLKDYLAAYSNNTTPPNEARHMKMKQFASSRQKSLPLYLETLSEEDESRSRISGIDPFDKETRLQMFLSDAMSTSGRSSNSERSHISSNQSESDSMSSCSERKGHSLREKQLHQRKAYRQFLATQKQENGDENKQQRNVLHNNSNPDNSQDKNRRPKRPISPFKNGPSSVDHDARAQNSPSRKTLLEHRESLNKKSPSRRTLEPSIPHSNTASPNDQQSSRHSSPRRNQFQGRDGKAEPPLPAAEKDSDTGSSDDVGASAHKRDNIYSTDSLEVADIMQNQSTRGRLSMIPNRHLSEDNEGGNLEHGKRNGHNKNVEPAMVSIILEDVDQSNGSSRDLLSVPSEGGHLNLPPSRCSSSSLSPIPQSPVTVIEVGLDNQQDSLDTEGTCSSKETDDENAQTSSMSSSEDKANKKHRRSHRRGSHKQLSEGSLSRRNSGRASPLPNQLSLNQRSLDIHETPSNRRLSLEVPVMPEVRQMLERQKALQLYQSREQEDSLEQKKSHDSKRRASFSEEDPIIINDVLSEMRARSPKLGRRSTSPRERRSKHRHSQEGSEEKRPEDSRRGSHSKDRPDSKGSLDAEVSARHEEVIRKISDRKRAHSPAGPTVCSHKYHYHDQKTGHLSQISSHRTLPENHGGLDETVSAPVPEVRIGVPRSNESSPGSSKSAFRFTGRATHENSPISVTGYHSEVSETDVDEFPTSVRLDLKPRRISNFAMNLNGETSDNEANNETQNQASTRPLKGADVPSPTLKFCDHRPTFDICGQSSDTKNKVCSISRAVQVSQATFPYISGGEYVYSGNSNSSEYYYACDRGIQCDFGGFKTNLQAVLGLTSFNKFTQTGVPKYDTSCQTPRGFIHSPSLDQLSWSRNPSQAKAVNTVVCLIGHEHTGEYKETDSAVELQSSAVDFRITNFDIVDETLQQIEAELASIDQKRNHILSEQSENVSLNHVDKEQLWQGPEKQQHLVSSSDRTRRIHVDRGRSSSVTLDERLPARFAPSTWQAATSLTNRVERQRTFTSGDTVLDDVKLPLTTQRTEVSTTGSGNVSPECGNKIDLDTNHISQEEFQDSQDETSVVVGSAEEGKPKSKGSIPLLIQNNALSMFKADRPIHQRTEEESQKKDSSFSGLSRNSFNLGNRSSTATVRAPSSTGPENKENTPHYPTVDSKHIMVKMFELQQGMASYLRPCTGMYDNVATKHENSSGTSNTHKGTIFHPWRSHDASYCSNAEHFIDLLNPARTSEPRRFSSPTIGQQQVNTSHSKLSRLKYQSNSHPNSSSSLDLELDFMNAGEPLGFSSDSKQQNRQVQKVPDLTENSLGGHDSASSGLDVSSNTQESVEEIVNETSPCSENLTDQNKNSDSQTLIKNKPSTDDENANVFQTIQNYASRENTDSEDDHDLTAENSKSKFKSANEEEMTPDTKPFPYIKSLSKTSVLPFTSAGGWGSGTSTPEIVVSPLRAFQMDFLQVPGSPKHFLTKASYPSLSSTPTSLTSTSSPASPLTPQYGTRTPEHGVRLTFGPDGTSNPQVFVFGDDKENMKDNVGNTQDNQPDPVETVKQQKDACKPDRLHFHEVEESEEFDELCRKGSMTDSDVQLSTIGSVTDHSYLSSVEQSADEFSDASMYPRLSMDSIMDGVGTHFDIPCEMEDLANLDMVEIPSFDATGMHPPVFDPDVLKLKRRFPGLQRSFSFGGHSGVRFGHESLDVASNKSVAGSEGARDVDDMEVLVEESRNLRLSSGSSYSDPVLDIIDSLSEDSFGSDSGDVKTTMSLLSANTNADDLLQVSDYGGRSPVPAQIRDAPEDEESPTFPVQIEVPSESRDLPPEPVKCDDDDSDDEAQEDLNDVRRRERFARRRGSRRGSKDNWEVVQSVLHWQSRDSIDESIRPEDVLYIAEAGRQRRLSRASLRHEEVEKINEEAEEDKLTGNEAESSGDECDKEISMINLHRPIIRKLTKMSSDPVDKELYCRSVQTQIQKLKEKTATLDQNNPPQESATHDLHIEEESTTDGQVTNITSNTNIETTSCDMLEIFQNADLSSLQSIVLKNDKNSRSSTQTQLKTSEAENNEEGTVGKHEEDTPGSSLYALGDIARVLDVEFTNGDETELGSMGGREDSVNGTSTDLMDELEMIALFKKIDQFEDISNSLIDTSSDSSPGHYPLSQISEEETQSEESVSDGSKRQVWQVRNRFIVTQDTQDTALDSQAARLSSSSRSSESNNSHSDLDTDARPDLGERSASVASSASRKNPSVSNQSSNEIETCDGENKSFEASKNIVAHVLKEALSQNIRFRTNSDTDDLHGEMGDFSSYSGSPNPALTVAGSALTQKSGKENIKDTNNELSPRSDIPDTQIVQSKRPEDGTYKITDENNKFRVTSSPPMQTDTIERKIDDLGTITTKHAISQTVTVTHFNAIATRNHSAPFTEPNHEKYVSTAVIQIGDYKNKDKPAETEQTKTPMTKNRRSKIIRALKTRLSHEASLSLEPSADVTGSDSSNINLASNGNSLSSTAESQEMLKDKVRSMFLLGESEPSVGAREAFTRRSVSHAEVDEAVTHTPTVSREESLKDKVRSMLLIEDTKRYPAKHSTNEDNRADVPPLSANTVHANTSELSHEDMKDKVRAMFLIEDSRRFPAKVLIDKDDSTDIIPFHEDTARFNNSVPSQGDMKEKVRSLFLIENTRSIPATDSIDKDNNPDSTPFSEDTVLISSSLSSKEAMKDKVRSMFLLEDNRNVPTTDSIGKDNIPDSTPLSEDTFGINSSGLSQEAMKEKVRSMFLLGSYADDAESFDTVRDAREIVHSPTLSKDDSWTSHEVGTSSVDENSAEFTTDLGQRSDQEEKYQETPANSDTGDAGDIKSRVKAMFLIDDNKPSGATGEVTKVSSVTQKSGEQKPTLPSLRRVKVTTMFSQNSEDASASFVTSAMPSELLDDMTNSRQDEQPGIFQKPTMYSIRTQLYDKEANSSSKGQALADTTAKRPRSLRTRDSLLKLHEQAKVSSSLGSDSDSDLSSALKNQGDYDIRQRDLALGRISSDNNDEDDPPSARLPENSNRLSPCLEEAKNRHGSPSSPQRDLISFSPEPPCSNIDLSEEVKKNVQLVVTDDTEMSSNTSETLAPKVVIQQPSEDSVSLQDPFRKFSLPVITPSPALSQMPDNNDNHLHEKVEGSGSDPGEDKDKSGAGMGGHAHRTVWARRWPRMQFLSPKSAQMPNKYYNCLPQRDADHFTRTYDDSHPELSYLDIVPKFSHEEQGKTPTNPQSVHHETVFFANSNRNITEHDDAKTTQVTVTGTATIDDCVSNSCPEKSDMESHKNIDRDRTDCPTLEISVEHGAYSNSISETRQNGSSAPETIRTRHASRQTLPANQGISVTIPPDVKFEPTSLAETSLPLDHEISANQVQTSGCNESDATTNYEKSLSITSRDSGFDSQCSPIDVAHKIADWKTSPFSIVREESSNLSGNSSENQNLSLESPGPLQNALHRTDALSLATAQGTNRSSTDLTDESFETDTGSPSTFSNSSSPRSGP